MTSRQCSCQLQSLKQRELTNQNQPIKMKAFALVVILATLRTGSCCGPDGSTTTAPPPSARCGVWDQDEERIMGGETTSGIIPWQVYLVDEDKADDVGPMCGGVILCPRYVLTSGYCSSKMDDDFVVVAADHDWTDTFDWYQSQSELATKHRVKARHDHPKYSSTYAHLNLTCWFSGGQCGLATKREYDFSILELEDPIRLYESSPSRAACLPDPKDYGFNRDTRFVASGWGESTAEHNIMSWMSKPYNLKHASVQYCSSESNSNGCYECPREEYKICTAAKGNAPCNGDEGGPLTWTDPQTSKVVLVGVVSTPGTKDKDWSCSSDNPKQTPTVYARVSSVLPWINEITGNCNAEINW